MSSTPVHPVGSQDIDSTLRENRLFPAPPEFAAKAHISSLEQYEALYKESIADPEKFWQRLPTTCIGFKSGTRYSIGIFPSPSGL